MFDFFFSLSFFFSFFFSFRESILFRVARCARNAQRTRPDFLANRRRRSGGRYVSGATAARLVSARRVRGSILSKKRSIHPSVRNRRTRRRDVASRSFDGRRATYSRERRVVEWRLNVYYETDTTSPDT